MLFSGLETISYNINRRKPNLKLFEFGKTYHQIADKRIENKHLSVFVTGNRTQESWSVSEKTSDFFYMKSVANNILERLGVRNCQPAPVESSVFSEGITLKGNKKELVVIGLVKKSILKEFDIKQDVFYADFNWDNLLDLVKNNSIQYQEIPKYPEVRRDFALLLNDAVSFNDIHEIGFKTEKKLLKNINLFDVYTGDNLPEGKKSYAVSFTLQDEQRTLTDKQIDKIMGKLQKRYEEELGAELR